MLYLPGPIGWLIDSGLFIVYVPLVLKGIVKMASPNRPKKKRSVFQTSGSAKALPEVWKAEKNYLVETERKAYQEKIYKWFDLFDKDQSRHLDEQELTAMFCWLEPDCDDADELSEGVGNSAVGTFIKQHIPNADEGITKDSIVQVVTMWNGYLKKRKYLDQLYSKFNILQDGLIDHSELKQLMIEVSKGPAGIRKPLNVSKEDGELFTSLIKARVDTGVTSSDILEAVVEWHKIRKAQMTGKTSFCVLL
jgi:Ca2+-binding EF-hand superfamily protein